jgi:hypothetical protein
MDPGSLSRSGGTLTARVVTSLACGAALTITLGAAAVPAARVAAVTNFGGRLYGVAAISPTDAWAVGDGSPTVLHWNGSSWAQVRVPPHGGGLAGVSADSASDVWAVGEDAKKTVTIHWNGTDWTRATTPSPGGTSVYGSSLTGVSAISPSDAWAVGTYSKPTASAEFQTLI